MPALRGFLKKCPSLRGCEGLALYASASHTRLPGGFLKMYLSDSLETDGYPRLFPLSLAGCVLWFCRVERDVVCRYLLRRIRRLRR